MEERGPKGEKFNIIDMGAGNGTKTRPLLETAIAKDYNFEFLPVDISHDSNKTLCKMMEDIAPKMNLTVLTASFEQGLDWLKENRKGKGVYFCF